MEKRTLIKWWMPLAAAVLLAVFALARQAANVAAEAEAAPPVLVIDAGHGGADGGAVAPDGTLESDINLDIALRIQALADFCGVPAVMTRAGSDIDYPPDAKTIAEKKVADQHARVALVNDTPGAVLLSIHQNIYPAASPHGIQVFYGPAAGGDAFAALAQKNLTAQLCPDNRRVAGPADRNIYLIKNVDCAAVLVECGFLSNRDDLEDLENSTYRMKLAAVLLASYLQYTRGTTT